jgi:hypothetical protein
MEQSEQQERIVEHTTDETLERGWVTDAALITGTTLGSAIGVATNHAIEAFKESTGEGGAAAGRAAFGLQAEGRVARAAWA